MANERWLIRLEAYLDGELTVEQAAAFTAEAQADPVLREELEARRADRILFRQVLAEDGGLAHMEIEPRVARPAADGRGGRIPWRNVGLGTAALAASVALLLLMPWSSRDQRGAEGPRSSLTRSGLVAAVRFGETPGRTLTLETGSADFTAGFGQATEGL